MAIARGRATAPTIEDCINVINAFAWIMVDTDAGMAIKIRSTTRTEERVRARPKEKEKAKERRPAIIGTLGRTQTSGEKSGRTTVAHAN